MAAFLLRRLLTALATLFLASLLLFSVMHLLPGDEVRALFGIGMRVDADLYRAVEHELGLDRPFLVQYARFLDDLVTLDFGRGLPVLPPGRDAVLPGPPIRPMLASALGVSARVVGGALLLQVVLAPVVARIATRRPGSPSDRWTNGLVVAVAAVPVLVTSIVVQTVFAHWTDWTVSPVWTTRVPAWQNVLPPVLGLGLGTAAHAALVARDEVLAALAEPWARAAAAVGLPRDRVVRHAWRPAAGTVAQVLAAHVAAVITGLVVVERVFLVPGIGTLALTAIRVQDRTMLVTILVVLVAFAIAASTLADLVQAVTDPRRRRDPAHA